MHPQRAILIGVSFTAAALLASLLYSSIRGPGKFAIGLKWTGRTVDDYSAFMVSLTNQTRAPVALNGILFQWVDKAGRIDGCHAFSTPQEMQSREVVTSYIAVPVGAKKLRILLCGAPGPIRKHVKGFLTKLPWP